MLLLNNKYMITQSIKKSKHLFGTNIPNIFSFLLLTKEQMFVILHLTNIYSYLIYLRFELGGFNYEREERIF